MNIVLIGPPGSGKGTQAKKILTDFDSAYFSAGDILRRLAEENSALGQEVAKNVGEGRLASDRLMAKIVEDFLAKNKGSIIFDGYPRGLDQAIFLEKSLAGRSGINLVINLQVPQGVLLSRLSSRVICRDCGAVFNLNTNPPKREGFCDICGGRLYQRDDEKPEAVRRRLAIFNRQTKPVIDFFKSKGLVFDVDGNQAIEAIYKVIKRRLIKIGSVPRQ
jgi:adenylate kinase